MRPFILFFIKLRRRYLQWSDELRYSVEWFIYWVVYYSEFILYPKTPEFLGEQNCSFLWWNDLRIKTVSCENNLYIQSNVHNIVNWQNSSTFLQNTSQWLLLKHWLYWFSYSLNDVKFCVKDRINYFKCFCFLPFPEYLLGSHQQLLTTGLPFNVNISRCEYFPMWIFEVSKFCVLTLVDFVIPQLKTSVRSIP